jgi:hypothetical protein
LPVPIIGDGKEQEEIAEGGGRYQTRAEHMFDSCRLLPGS